MGTTVCCGNRQPNLLGDLESVGLGPFGVIWPQIDVHDGPAIFVGDLRAEPIDVIIRPANSHHRRAEDQAAQNLSLLQIVRDHDKATNARHGRVGGRAVGQVPRAGAADRVEAKFDRLGDGHGNDALFVRIGRVVAGIILDPKIGAAQFLREPIALCETG